MSAVLFEASSPLQLAFLVGMIEDGVFDGYGPRFLLYSANNRKPEIEGFHIEFPDLIEALGNWFESVTILNDLIHPFHPSQWIEAKESPFFRRYFEQVIAKQPISLLVLESIQVPPAQTIASALPWAEIHLYADGLMAYSPTRFVLLNSIVDRITKVHYPGFIGNLQPLLLREGFVNYEERHLEVLIHGLNRLTASLQIASLQNDHVIFVGQNLSGDGIMSEESEISLYLHALRDLKQKYPNAEILFKAHPACSSTVVKQVGDTAASEYGDHFLLMAERLPVELFFNSKTLVVSGIFSTSLFIAKSYFAIPVRTFGIHDVLQCLPKIENSNRVPLVLADQVLSDNEDDADVRSLRGLVATIGYAMQPEIMRTSRAAVIDSLPDVWAEFEFLDVYVSGKKSLFADLRPSLDAARGYYEQGLFDESAVCSIEALRRTPSSSLNAMQAALSYVRICRFEVAAKIIRALSNRQKGGKDAVFFESRLEEYAQGRLCQARLARELEDRLAAILPVRSASEGKEGERFISKLRRTIKGPGRGIRDGNV